MIFKNSLYSDKLINEDLQPCVRLFYMRDWHTYEMKTHSHDQVEIMYVTSGQCIVSTGNCTHIMKKADFILLDAGTPHNLVIQKDRTCRILNVEFAFSKIACSFPPIRILIEEIPSMQEFFGMKLDYLVLKDTDEIIHTLKSLIMELNDKLHNDYLIQLLIAELLINISRLAVKQRRFNPKANSYIRKVIFYINTNYDCNIRIKDLAFHVNINEAYLQRAFKKQTGKTIIEYINLLRLEKAAEILVNTDIPVIDVCSYVGINSRQYFTKLFKTYKGYSPQEYRKIKRPEIGV